MNGPLKPTEPSRPILERAFNLARDGDFPDLQALEAALRREGYAQPEIRLSGPSLRKQLRGLLATRPVADLPD